MMHPASEAMVKWAMGLRAVNNAHYVELVAVMGMMREHYRDRAIEGPVDNGLAIGFARGIDHVLKLLRDAPQLTEEMTRMARS